MHLPANSDGYHAIMRNDSLDRDRPARLTCIEWFDELDEQLILGVDVFEVRQTVRHISWYLDVLSVGPPDAIAPRWVESDRARRHALAGARVRPAARVVHFASVSRRACRRRGRVAPAAAPAPPAPPAPPAAAQPALCRAPRRRRRSLIDAPSYVEAGNTATSVAIISQMTLSKYAAAAAIAAMTAIAAPAGVAHAGEAGYLARSRRRLRLRRHPGE